MQMKRMKADYYYSLGLKIAASEAFTIPNRMQILMKSSDNEICYFVVKKDALKAF